MIRDYREEDLNEVMDIWLNTNIQAHDFIPSTYWEDNYDEVKKMMPQASIYVYVSENKIQGFIGLQGSHIAGLFVRSHMQSIGIGRELLNFTKERNNKLSLHVYKENLKAMHFYTSNEFHHNDEYLDENNKKIECNMVWGKYS